MKNLLVKKKLTSIITICFMILILYGPTINGSNIKYVSSTYENTKENTSIVKLDYVDISVQAAWNMLSNTSDGIQIPIDVRSYGEWYEKRINTPYPEYPRFYSLSNLRNEDGLKQFIELYDGSEIIVYCQSGGRSSTAAQILSDSNFNGTIYNMLGGISAWISAGLPIKMGNQPPNTPNTPTGPTTGNSGVSYVFSSQTTDPDDDVVKLGWDWNNDDIVDEWTEYYPSNTNITTSHIFTTSGIFDIKVIAEDLVGEQSNFSSVLTITINSPPEPPTIIGETKGKAGQEYKYTFSATDPDDDEVYLYVDWGDDNVEEWIGPFSSGEKVNLTHNWNKKGTYTIKAKAKDYPFEAESGWGTLEINMAKQNIIIKILLWIIDFLKNLFNITSFSY